MCSFRRQYEALSLKRPFVLLDDNIGHYLCKDNLWTQQIETMQRNWSIIWVGGWEGWGGGSFVFLDNCQVAYFFSLWCNFFAKIVQLGTFSYFEKVWCDGAGPKLVLLALSKVLGLWSLWFHNKGSSSKCEPQTGEICWNNQTFLKSGGREGGNLKFSCSNEILTKKANKYFWSITTELFKLNTMPPNKLQ